MASRIEYIPHEEPVRQRRPRQTDERHLRFIRKLPCAVSGMRPVDPAHLRAGCLLVGKRPVGVGEKPSDRWTIPLHRSEHDVQHRMNELAFWRYRGIDNPFQLALALFAASVAEDFELAENILAQHRMLAGVR